MKTLLIITMIIGIFCVTGCNEKVNSTSNDLPDKEKVDNTINEMSIPRPDICNYRAEDIEEFKRWITNPDSKKQNNGAFKELLELYLNYNYILLPTISNKEIDNIFLDSNANLIHFVFTDPSVRFCIEPINIKENEEFVTTDITGFMKDKYDVEYNVEKEITDNETEGKKSSDKKSDKIKTGYEYDTHYFRTKKVKMKEKTINCVLDKKQSEKSNTENILSFIQDGMLIRAIYYDEEEKEFNLNDFETLSFDKIILK